MFSSNGDSGKENGREIDEKLAQTSRSLKSKFVLIPSIEIKAWKAFAILVFVAGFAAALVWSAYNKWYIDSGAKEKEGKPAMTLIIDKDSWTTGESFSANIVLNTAAKNTVAVNAVGRFDPSMFEATGIDISSSDFPLEIAKNLNNTVGTFSVALARKKPGVNSGAARVAVVNFRVLKNATSTALNMKFDTKNAKDDSAAIADDGLGTNILETVSLLCASCGKEKKSCGDGKCKADETCLTCAADCGLCLSDEKSCGDGQCKGNETCSTCKKDCGACAAENKYTPLIVVNKSSRALTSEESYSTRAKKISFKGKNPEIADGKVRIFQDGKLVKISKVKKSGAWSKEITISKARTFKFQFKFYDKSGKEIYASENFEIIKVK